MCRRPRLTYCEVGVVQFEPVNGPAALRLCTLTNGTGRPNEDGLTVK